MDQEKLLAELAACNCIIAKIETNIEKIIADLDTERGALDTCREQRNAVRGALAALEHGQ